MRGFTFMLLLAIVFSTSLRAAEPPANLALDAKAGASETQDNLTPEKAIDGDLKTRWSGIPGHNAGVWYQLDWKQPIEIGEVVVHQYDRYVMEFDVQVRPTAAAEWRTVQHFGRPGDRLPIVVACRFGPLKASGVRIGNITNGPSFTEVEVHARPFAGGTVTQLASDLRGHFLGMVTDPWGSAPVAGAAVSLSGSSRGGPWQATAVSNDKGMFEAPMPLGLTGEVSIRTVPKPSGTDSSPVEFRMKSAAFQEGLTPRIPNDARCLDGKWKFSLDPPEDFWEADFDDKEWASITVPAHWEMEGFRSPRGVGGYRLRFALPSGEGRAKLRFEGVYSGAEVWVNGQLVATHEGGATPFEVDVTDVATRGENLLALRVKEHTTVSDQLDHMSHYADFPLAGIMRPVYLFRVPGVHLGAVELVTTFDKNYRNALLRIRAVVWNESAAEYRGNLRFALSGSDVLAGRAMQFSAKPWQRAVAETSLPVKAPKTWTAERPNLYSLDLRLEGAEQLTLPVGFRQTEIRGPEILVNGKPIKLRGTCHHDSYPLTGRAVTAELQRRDVALMKEANLNAVRTSHYPPLPELLKAADELGLYVEDEASFCWAGVTDDLRNTPRVIQLTAELLARDRNHPSVTFWSVCNESQFGYGFQRSHEWVRAADPSRPTSAATSAWLEIATLHNPLAVARIDENEKLDKPLIFDESLGIFQGIFNDVAEMWVDPGIRDYYTVPLLAVYDRFMKSKSTQGSMIWCWADDIFCVPGRGYEYGRGTTRSHFLDDVYRVPGRGLTGDAPWGVVDGWRRQKPEFWITKKLHSPVKMKESPIALPRPGEPLRIAVENQYDFRNLSDLKILWSLGDENGTALADVPPRSTGVVEIRPSRPPRDGEILDIRFEEPSRLVDAYRVPLGHGPRHAAECEKCANAALKIHEEDVLAGPCTTVSGKDFELAWDRESGMLRRGVVKGQPLLLEMPTLHLLRTDRPLQPLPDRFSWRLEKFEVRQQGENVHVSIRGSYREFQGGYEVEITPVGQMTVASSFQYSGEEFRARETGLRFSVPRDCDVLDWDRRATWNVYPPDHIGRPRGTARAFSGRARAVPPTCPCSEDDSPLGSNDFRSTKRDIYWAAIHYSGGPGAVVESAGRQHVRAAVESDRTSLHVNDFYGGTNVGWWEWTLNYGQGKVVRKGDRITSTVKLQIAPRILGK
jgi:beta-galactosidase